MTATLRLAVVSSVVLTTLACSGATPTETQPLAVRLVDLFDAKRVQGSVKPATTARPTIWRFDGTPLPPTAKFAATRGWEPGPGVAGLIVKDGQLTGRVTTDGALIHLERTSGLDVPDTLHAIEVKMRASHGANISIQTSPGETVNLADLSASARRLPWQLESPIISGEAFQTYELIPRAPIVTSRIRHLVIRPTDASEGTFAIESVRLVSRTEHLASIPAGVGWQGLQQIYRESLVAHAPESMQFDVQLPDRPWLDLAVGTVEDGAVTFSVVAKPEGAADDRDVVQADLTVTRPHRWDSYPVDLSRLAGKRVTLSLQLKSESAGALGFWGSPVVRTLGAFPTWRLRSAAGGDLHPSGYAAPRPLELLRTRARDRSVSDAPGQGGCSIQQLDLSGQLDEGFDKLDDDEPVSVDAWCPHADRIACLRRSTTMAEAYKAAGYATLSMSSVAFTGQNTNLHQGYEELHENGSLTTAGTPLSSKSAREYVDRLVPWLDRHREVPFFVYLQVFDPHSPFEPYGPYNTKFGDPARTEQHRKEKAAVTKLIEDPVMRGRGLPTRNEVIKAGFDPDIYVKQEADWYDGSIRGMDVEIGRLFEQLRRLGLDERTLVVLTSDHGTELLDHGRFFHGHTLYGELTNVPLIMRWPGRLPAARVIEDLVQGIDIMPTMLELSGIAPPAGLQGQSLRPFLATSSAGESERPEVLAGMESAPGHFGTSA